MDYRMVLTYDEIVDTLDKKYLVGSTKGYILLSIYIKLVILTWC